MPLDHFLPATYLAGFSGDKNPIRRDRRLWVADKQKDKVFEASASRVCAINDFYTIQEPFAGSSRALDIQWHVYEGPLANAINKLITGDIDWHTWLKVMVQFVAGLLVRGPDFNSRFLRRFKSRWPDVADYPGLSRILQRKDNTNMARFMEFQRLLAPICGARWTILVDRR